MVIVASRPTLCLLAISLVASAGACASAPARPRADIERDSIASLAIVVRETDSVGVRGVVRAQNGRALGDAVVAVDAKHVAAYTDSLGRFRMQLPPGRYSLRTLRVGYDRRTDSVRVPSVGGLALEIPMHEAAVYLMNVCACDPVWAPVVTLEIRTEARAPIRYAIVTTRISDEPCQRDSIPATDFFNGVATRRVLGLRQDGVASVEVRAPGYREWRDRATHLPTTMYVVLKPESNQN